MKAYDGEAVGLGQPALALLTPVSFLRAELLHRGRPRAPPTAGWSLAHALLPEAAVQGAIPERK